MDDKTREAIKRVLNGIASQRLKHPSRYPNMDAVVLSLEAADTITNALKGVAEGSHVIVPREPSEKMVESGEAAYSVGYSGTPIATPDKVYRAMLIACVGE